jgi:DNA-binding beta-propeller fold protein YncE
MALLVVAALTACAMHGISPSISPVGGANAGTGSDTRSATIERNELYVANLYALQGGQSDITIYGPGATQPLRTLVIGKTRPFTLAFDGAGNLFVANQNVPGSVMVYAPGTRSVSRTIRDGIDQPQRLLLDPSGNLYVANDGYPCNANSACGSIAFYPRGDSSPKWIIKHLKNSHLLAIDPSDNLYVIGNAPNTMWVYAAGGSMRLRGITDGLDVPAAMAFDAAGNLYVANDGSGTSTGSVTVYAPGGSSVLRTITRGIFHPNTLAFDEAGNLYVGTQDTPPDALGGSIAVYPPGGTFPLRKIRKGIALPVAMAFDAANNLYVDNYGCVSGASSCGSITVYAAGGASLLRKISKGINLPTTMAFGP